ncbi:MAG: hypothetical protein O7B99_06880 [Planctomycetota bacterium]|nr:hypothetical protein [Planctomycetota bacterium]
MAQRGQRKRREPDPPTQMETLRAALAARQGAEVLARGYLLRGEERWFRERAIALVRARAEELSYEVCAHDADDPDFDLARLIDDLSGGGLFAARRCVIVRNPGNHLRKVGGDDAPLTRAIIARLQEGGEDAIVVSAGSLRLDHAVAKAIVAADGFQLNGRKLWDTPPSWGGAAELVVWLMNRARELQIRLTPDQAELVVEATGNDLFALEDQLERLRDAPASDGGSGNDVQSRIAWDRAGSQWAVADSLARGELPRALSTVETYFGGGFQERDGKRTVDTPALVNVLLNALYTVVRRSLTIARELGRGAAQADALAVAGVSGRAIQPTLDTTGRRTALEWQARLDDLAKLERRSRSGSRVNVEDFTLLALRWAQSRNAASLH